MTKLSKFFWNQFLPQYASTKQHWWKNEPVYALIFVPFCLFIYIPLHGLQITIDTLLILRPLEFCSWEYVTLLRYNILLKSSAFDSTA